MNVDDKNYREILQLIEKFVGAVKNSDKETAAQIADDKMKIEFKTVSGSYIRDFDKNNLNETSILLKPSEVSPYVSIRPNQAQIIYERKSHCHFAESDFQNGFLRQAYSFKQSENHWKLSCVKTEVRRFSRYNLKESLLGLLECLFIKVMKRKWIIKA
jgi:hypothetical protein